MLVKFCNEFMNENIVLFNCLILISFFDDWSNKLEYSISSQIFKNVVQLVTS